MNNSTIRKRSGKYHFPSVLKDLLNRLIKSNFRWILSPFTIKVGWLFGASPAVFRWSADCIIQSLHESGQLGELSKFNPQLRNYNDKQLKRYITRALVLEYCFSLGLITGHNNNNLQQRRASYALLRATSPDWLLTNITQETLQLLTYEITISDLSINTLVGSRNISETVTQFVAKLITSFDFDYNFLDFRQEFVDELPEFGSFDKFADVTKEQFYNELSFLKTLSKLKFRNGQFELNRPLDLDSPLLSVGDTFYISEADSAGKTHLYDFVLINDGVSLFTSAYNSLLYIRPAAQVDVYHNNMDPFSENDIMNNNYSFSVIEFCKHYIKLFYTIIRVSGQPSVNYKGLTTNDTKSYYMKGLGPVKSQADRQHRALCAYLHTGLALDIPGLGSYGNSGPSKGSGPKAIGPLPKPNSNPPQGGNPVQPESPQDDSPSTTETQIIDSQQPKSFNPYPSSLERKLMIQDIGLTLETQNISIPGLDQDYIDHNLQNIFQRYGPQGLKLAGNLIKGAIYAYIQKPNLNVQQTINNELNLVRDFNVVNNIELMLGKLPVIGNLVPKVVSDQRRLT